MTLTTCNCNLLYLCHPGHGKTPKDAASVRATHPIPAACGVYYFEVKIISKGRDGYVKKKKIYLLRTLFFYNECTQLFIYVLLGYICYMHFSFSNAFNSSQPWLARENNKSFEKIKFEVQTDW